MDDKSSCSQVDGKKCKQGKQKKLQQGETINTIEDKAFGNGLLDLPTTSFASETSAIVEAEVDNVPDLEPPLSNVITVNTDVLEYADELHYNDRFKDKHEIYLATNDLKAELDNEGNDMSFEHNFESKHINIDEVIEPIEMEKENQDRDGNKDNDDNNDNDDNKDNDDNNDDNDNNNDSNYNDSSLDNNGDNDICEINQIDDRNKTDSNVDTDLDNDNPEESELTADDTLSLTDSRNLHTEQNRISHHRINSRIMAPYLCIICQNYVRGGVITICGHLFCWTCLWPNLNNRMHPKCPRCNRRLIFHEDIMPFHGEGPNAGPEDANVTAWPGNVPRPSGLYLSDLHYPDWFSVNDFENIYFQTGDTAERHLYSLIIRIEESFPALWKWVIFFNRIQSACTIMIFIMWLIALLY